MKKRIQWVMACALMLSILVASFGEIGTSPVQAQAGVTTSHSYNFAINTPLKLPGFFNLTLPPAPDLTVITINNVSFDCSTIQEIPVSECEALVQFYIAMNGPNWTHQNGFPNQPGWLQINHPCDYWYGVSCNGDGTHVTNIEEPGNNLTGSLNGTAAILSNFPKLIHLNLADNALSGSIPSGYGNLTSLTYLTLNSNQLTGEIPTELGNLTNLVYLQLNDNQLSGSLPASLSNLDDLFWLDVANNNLVGDIPEEYGGMTDLDDLEVDHNPMVGILPMTLINLKLTKFFFDSTGLCEPDNNLFQSWLEGIPVMYGTDTCFYSIYLPLIRR